MNTRLYSLSLLLLRLAFGFRLIYGTYDNVFIWDRMLEFEAFLAQHGFPFPLFCAVLSVYAQFLAGLCWIIGFQVRPAAWLMAGNFIVALLGVHIGDAYLNAAPAVHLLVVSFFLAVNGGGEWALDGRG